jgi:uracil-DNA glycosylase family 4
VVGGGKCLGQLRQLYVAARRGTEVREGLAAPSYVLRYQGSDTNAIKRRTLRRPGVVRLEAALIKPNSPDRGTSEIRVDNQGNRTARLFILGEAPGVEEERQGKPFVGEAGRLLFWLLAELGVSREDVFVGNVVRYRPWSRTTAGKLKDRKPSTKEIDADGRVFREELATIHPVAVLTLGVTAAEALGLDTRLGIAKLRGHQIDVAGLAVVPSFHPGYILRDGRKMNSFVNDLQACVRLLEDRTRHPLAP